MKTIPNSVCTLCGMVGVFRNQVLNAELRGYISWDSGTSNVSVPLCCTCSSFVAKIGKLRSAYNLRKAEFEDYVAGLKTVVKQRLGNENLIGTIGVIYEDSLIEVHDVKREETDNEITSNTSVLNEPCGLSDSIQLVGGAPDLNLSVINRPKCDDCGKQFGETRNLILHKQKLICKKVIPRGSREKQPKKCYFCDMILTGISTLATHLRKHTTEYPILKCGKCGKCYRDETTFIKHNIVCNTSLKQLQHLPKTIISRIEKEREKTSKEKNQCPKCQNIYKTRISLLAHYRTQCGKGSGEKLQRRPSSQLFKAGKFQCDLCLKIYKYRKQLLLHKEKGICKIRLLRKSSPKSCYFCGFKSSGLNALARHLWQHTNEYPSYECFKCRKVYRDEGTFVQHCIGCLAPDEQHQELRNNMTEKIVKKRMRIAQESSLVEHKCPECGKVYQTKKGLATHMKTKCGGDGSNLFEVRKRYRDVYYAMKQRQRKSDFKCTTCGKNFAQASRLKTHLMFNCEKVGRYCTLCKTLFDTKEEKKQHWLKDHYKAIYRCYFCEKDIKDKSYLAGHMSFHTKETPFKCKSCWKRFLLPQYLDYHCMKLCRKNGKKFGEN